jgi:hypothetical protein
VRSSVIGEVLGFFPFEGESAPLSALESTLKDNSQKRLLLSPLESILTFLKDLKPLRINTYAKGGRGGTGPQVPTRSEPETPAPAVDSEL